MRSTLNFIGERRTLEKLVGKHGGGGGVPRIYTGRTGQLEFEKAKGVVCKSFFREEGNDSEGKETTRT